MKARKMTEKEHENLFEMPVIDSRKKIIWQNLKTLSDNDDVLDEWTLKFYTNIKSWMLDGKDLTQRQFNKLQEVAGRYK